MCAQSHLPVGRISLILVESSGAANGCEAVELAASEAGALGKSKVL